MAAPFTPVTLCTSSRKRCRSEGAAVHCAVRPVGLQSLGANLNSAVAEIDKMPPNILRGNSLTVGTADMAIQQTGVPPPDAGASWWIQRILLLPPTRCNGWVLAQVIDEFRSECKLAELLHKETFATRMAKAGLQTLADTSQTPRKRCVAIGAAGQNVAALLAILAQVRGHV